MSYKLISFFCYDKIREVKTKWVGEWVSEWVIEWMNEWMSVNECEWVSELVDE